MSDDDLRFGDVSGGDGGGGGLNFDPAPLVVAGVVVLILLVGQPLSSDIGGISMNFIGALVVGAGGLMAGFDGE